MNSSIANQADGVFPTPARLGAASGIIMHILRLFLGCVFVLSAAAKLPDPGGFYAEVIAFDLIGPNLTEWVAYGVPVFELLLAFCLFSGIALGGALWLSLVALLGFTALHVRVVALGQSLDCGCFGSTTPIGYATVTRNTLFAVAGLLALTIYIRQARRDNAPARQTLDPPPPKVR